MHSLFNLCGKKLVGRSISCGHSSYLHLRRREGRTPPAASSELGPPVGSSPGPMVEESVRQRIVPGVRIEGRRPLEVGGVDAPGISLGLSGLMRPDLPRTSFGSECARMSARGLPRGPRAAIIDPSAKCLGELGLQVDPSATFDVREWPGHGPARRLESHPTVGPGRAGLEGDLDRNSFTGRCFIILVPSMIRPEKDPRRGHRSIERSERRLILLKLGGPTDELRSILLERSIHPVDVNNPTRDDRDHGDPGHQPLDPKP
jgi:hypothetical protein